MEAPEKIYVFENPISEEPDDRWLSKRSDENDVEYTSTEAFIEKACEWLKENAGDYVVHHWNETTLDTMSLIDDFKEYMKSE